MITFSDLIKLHAAIPQYRKGEGWLVPNKPKRLCPKCQQVVQGPCKQCTTQRTQQYEQARAPSVSEYKTNRWKRYSAWFRMTHPLCVDCERKGVLSAAEVVGHIKPAKFFPELFWEPTNHKPQCTKCNREQEVSDAKRYGDRK